MRKVATKNAPEAIGPYSQAIIAGDLVFCSGQIALRPDGTFFDGTITEQTTQVLQNLQEVLKAAGSSIENVVKTTCFLSDMDDFQAFNEVYGSVFGESKPARATIEVSKLPRDAKVEIEAVAALK